MQKQSRYISGTFPAQVMKQRCADFRCDHTELTWTAVAYSESLIRMSSTTAELAHDELPEQRSFSDADELQDTHLE